MDTCVCCGAVIPEGRMVCWACENGQGVSPERRANGTVGTADEINAFRAAMIDGTPTALTSTVDSYAVSSALTNAKSNNAATAIQGYQSYEADITPKLLLATHWMARR